MQTFTPHRRSANLARPLALLLALSLSTALSACGPSPTGQAGPSATPSLPPASPAASPQTPARALAAMSLRLQADTALAGFNTAQQAPFALCLSQIAAAEHRIFISSELPAASRSALEAAGILVTRSGGVTSLRLSKALSLRELLAGVEISLPGLPVGELEGRSIFKNASGAELGFVTWNASLAEGGSQLGILLAPSAETNTGEACPRLQVSLTGGRLKSASGQVIAAPSSGPAPAQSSSPSPVASAGTSTPTTPAGLQVVEASTTALTLKWDFGGEAVTYTLYLDGKPVAANHSSPDYYTFSGLTASSSYRLGVQAVSTAGPVSEIASLSAATLASGRSASGNFSGGGSGGGSSAPDPLIVFVPVSEEFQANQTTDFDQDNPDLAMAADGSFVVVWDSEFQDNGSSSGIYGRRYDSSASPLGDEFRINSYTTNNQSEPAIAMNRSGDFVVVWTSSGADGDATGIAAQRYDSQGGRIGTEFLINDYTTGAQFTPSVAIDDDGGFAVSWVNDIVNAEIRVRRFDSDGEALTDELHVNSYTTGLQLDPKLALDNSGRFVVVWASDAQDGDGLGIYGQRYDSAGAPSGEEFPVNQTTTSYQSDPSVVMASDGSFSVAWVSNQSQDSTEIYLRRFNRSGRALSDETRVNTHTDSDQYLSELAINREGEVLAVWDSVDQDGDSDGIFAQRFSASGAREGDEFQVNIYNTDTQGEPAAALDADGNFAVVWLDGNRDEGTHGIFGLRFEASEVEEVVDFAAANEVFSTHCSRCHGDRFASYPEARSLAETIRNRVFVDRDMPRIGSDEAEAISEAERQLIADWVDQGMQP